MESRIKPPTTRSKPLTSAPKKDLKPEDFKVHTSSLKRKAEDLPQRVTRPRIEPSAKPLQARQIATQKPKETSKRSVSGKAKPTVIAPAKPIVTAPAKRPQWDIKVFRKYITIMHHRDGWRIWKRCMPLRLHS